MLLLTGKPGTGKTTVLSKAIEILKLQGYSVGGMISREVRSGNARMGFEILNLKNNQHGWLARVDYSIGPRIGKYHVNLEDLDRIGVKAITDALGTCDIVAIDEIGPMELSSDDFKKAIKIASKSQRLVIATIHWALRTSAIKGFENLSNIKIYEVTLSNRNSLHKSIAGEADSILRKQLGA